MKKIILLSLIIFSLFSCSNEVKMQGTWDAVWETSPESFGKITGIESFTMNGEFVFYGDSITIIAHGYKGCIFGVDTIQHSQTWNVQNDTLYLVNETNLKGISYFIKSKDENSIELQLMEDIFIHLKK
jgi:hypothetical protein|tara:strand:- start:906 stop:1289 length:384 start_codon:yes stop_codon:yes gene_type:complete